eukprot:gb/GECH01012637.1/.p1 GENE.gb/GECH01012637.1/~~gb/GECH01012637.1/.p1  ORF type:complete len:123 (+),score=17.90 gb/GECH01012637.1/:1-369(+)
MSRTKLLKKPIEYVTAAVDFNKKLSEKPKNFFEHIAHVPNYGLGMNWRRKTWKHVPNSHWTLTKLKLSPDGRHGKAWGYLTWKGLQIPRQQRIPGTLKRGQWNYVAPNPNKKWPVPSKFPNS